MTEITVKFINLRSDSKLLPLCANPRIPPGSTITNATMLSNGEVAVVYKGILSHRGTNKQEEIVLKIVRARNLDHRDALEKEFGFYERQLKDLQGTMVPRCYGLFKTKNDLNICLALEYCGKQLEQPFFHLDLDTRLDILDRLMEIHEMGVAHNDFDEKNVVFNKNGQPFIVDFEHATAHDCPRAYDVLEGESAPNKCDFGCFEIWDYCYENGIWRPGYFPILGAVVLESCATSADAVYATAKANGARGDEALIRQRANEIYDLVLAIKKNNGLMPRKAARESLLRSIRQ